MIYVGIDIGGTGIKTALVNDKGEILVKDSFPTRAERPGEEILADMADMIRKLAEKAGVELKELAGIGMGFPGLVDPEKGELVYAVNLPTCRNLAAGEYMRKTLGLPLYVDNDANVAALGEGLFGAGQGNTRCLVMITLGTGIGGGVIINGHIFAGAFHGGTELGHTVIVENGEPCSCGRRGCWEAYSSATGLIRAARREAQLTPDSLLWEMSGHDLDNIDGKMVGDAADRDDPAACKVMDEYLRHLAVGLGNMYNIFQPEILILGGGVSGRGDKLLTPLRELMVGEVYNNDVSHLDIRIATLGNDAGVIGAASLVMAEGPKG